MELPLRNLPKKRGSAAGAAGLLWAAGRAFAAAGAAGGACAGAAACRTGAALGTLSGAAGRLFDGLFRLRAGNAPDAGGP